MLHVSLCYVLFTQTQESRANHDFCRNIPRGRGNTNYKDDREKYRAFLGTEIYLVMIVDSGALSNTLTVRSQSCRKSVRGCISVIAVRFELKAVSKSVCVSGKMNLATSTGA